MRQPDLAIGSRGSPLALAQARLVHESLARAGQASHVVIIETDGDRRAPDTAWGEGAFVAAIERALLAGRVDLAVHSAKDVPTTEDARLRIGAFLPRADPRDALVVRAGAVARRLDDLPPGTRIGTDSPRRTGFLLARRPDLACHPLHGNVDTRLRRLEVGETDALVLACAGLDRLGRGERIAERLDPRLLPPAPGQGAIAVQARRQDSRTLDVLLALDDAATRLAVEAERAVLAAAGGGCRSPIGALATVEGGQITVLGGYAATDGSDTAFAVRHGPAMTGADLARGLAAELVALARAGRPAGSGGGTMASAAPPRVLVTRAEDQAGELIARLRDAGLAPVAVPAIAIDLVEPGGPLDDAVRRLDAYAWVVVASANGVRAIREAAGRVGARLGGPSWAALGPATRAALERDGIDVAMQPSESSGAALAAEVPVVAGCRILVVRGDLAGGALAASLRERGGAVDDVIGYRTAEAPSASSAVLREAVADGPLSAVVFTSGSTVRGLVALAEAEAIDVLSVPAVCIGPATEAEAARAGFRLVTVATAPDTAAIVAATARAAAAPAAAAPVPAGVRVDMI